MQIFNIFFVVSLNKLLNKWQSNWWFNIFIMLVWCHCFVTASSYYAGLNNSIEPILAALDNKKLQFPYFITVTSHWALLRLKITSFSTVWSAIYSRAHQRKHQSSKLLAFVKGIHWWQVDFPHKGPVMQKMFSFDDLVMFRLGIWQINSALLRPIVNAFYQYSYL